MRILLIDCYAASHPDAHVVDSAIRSLGGRGHEIDHLALSADEPTVFMSADERLAYETSSALVAEDTKASADRVKRADALLFCYPTTMFGVPPRLKAWLERVMVPGVAFVFDDERRVRRALRNIRRIGVITTSPHSNTETMRARDLGRRTLLRALRLNCHTRCKTTFLRLPAAMLQAHTPAKIEKRFVGWR